MKTTASRSPLTELLVYPTPTQTKGQVKTSARVQTSKESIALLERNDKKGKRNGREAKK